MSVFEMHPEAYLSQAGTLKWESHGGSPILRTLKERAGGAS